MVTMLRLVHTFVYICITGYGIHWDTSSTVVHLSMLSCFDFPRPRVTVELTATLSAGTGTRYTIILVNNVAYTTHICQST